jgi:D-alanyl-D-alanine carboxypeptidase
VTGDYRGDVLVHQATYDPTSGSWTIRGLPTVNFGQSGDIPQAGNFAGDYRADRAVWRPATGEWLIRVEPSLPALPACDISDAPTTHSSLTDWNRSVLDRIFKLPSTYAPTDLRSTSAAGLNAGQTVRSVALPDLRAMAAAAATAHAPLAAQSGYRSYATQVSTFNYYVSIQGFAQAIQASARPGHSEHQLGTTVDFRSAGGPPAWSYPDWAATAAGAWMKANAWRYGFLMSYPAGRTSMTCYKYEPWHYRYVGRAKAAQVRASGLTLREFLWRQQVS